MSRCREPSGTEPPQATSVRLGSPDLLSFCDRLSIIARDFAVGNGAEGLPGVERDIVADEMHRAVGEECAARRPRADSATRPCRCRRNSSSCTADSARGEGCSNRGSNNPDSSCSACSGCRAGCSPADRSRCSRENPDRAGCCTRPGRGGTRRSPSCCWCRRGSRRSERPIVEAKGRLQMRGVGAGNRGAVIEIAEVGEIVAADEGAVRLRHCPAANPVRGQRNTAIGTDVSAPHTHRVGVAGEVGVARAGARFGSILR